MIEETQAVVAALGGQPSLFDKIGASEATRTILFEVAGALVFSALGAVYIALSRRYKAVRTKPPHWIASESLLHDVLFDEWPRGVAEKLVARIVKRLAKSVGVKTDLLRAARFFVEGRLLDAARHGRKSPIPLETIRVRATFRALEPNLTNAVQNLGSEQIQPATFENCFQLENLRYRGSRYFMLLMELEARVPADARDAVVVEYPDRFLTPIAVEDGFVAPMFLISGLLQQFETQWPLALRKFNQSTEGSSLPLATLQRFALYCWLLWGPSIPACTCDGWDGSFMVLQYGYGDEAESFPLILDESVFQDVETMLRRLVSENGPEFPFAFGMVFNGTIVWGPRYRLEKPDDYPAVFKVPTSDPKRRTFANKRETPIFDGLMLRASSLTKMNPRRSYYSAYAWVMFEVCIAGEPAQAGAGPERWRRLFPIFEHVDIADREGLAFLKSRLAEKACRAVKEFEETAPGARHLRYVCAIDDPGDVLAPHGPHLARFVTDSAVVDAVRDRKSGVPAPGDTRLSSMIRSELGDDVDRINQMFSKPTDPNAIITACDLPEIVEEFYRDFLEAPWPN